MNILEEIIEHKRSEVADRKKRVRIEELEKSEQFSRNTYSLAEFLVDPSRTGIIAEFTENLNSVRGTAKLGAKNKNQDEMKERKYRYLASGL